MVGQDYPAGVRAVRVTEAARVVLAKLRRGHGTAQAPSAALTRPACPPAQAHAPSQHAGGPELGLSQDLRDSSEALRKVAPRPRAEADR